MINGVERFDFELSASYSYQLQKVVENDLKCHYKDNEYRTINLIICETFNVNGLLLSLSDRLIADGIPSDIISCNLATATIRVGKTQYKAYRGMNLPANRQKTKGTNPDEVWIFGRYHRQIEYVLHNDCKNVKLVHVTRSNKPQFNLIKQKIKFDESYVSYTKEYDHFYEREITVVNIVN